MLAAGCCCWDCCWDCGCCCSDVLWCDGSVPCDASDESVAYMCSVVEVNAADCMPCWPLKSSDRSQSDNKPIKPWWCCVCCCSCWSSWLGCCCSSRPRCGASPRLCCGWFCSNDASNCCDELPCSKPLSGNCPPTLVRFESNEEGRVSEVPKSGSSSCMISCCSSTECEAYW